MEVIHDNDHLLRRIPFRDPNFVKDDGTLSSAGFSIKKGEDGLSVDIERLTSYEVAIQNREKYRLYYLLASDTTSLGLENIHDPQEDNYAHALVKGKFTRGISRALAQAALRISFPE